MKWIFALALAGCTLTSNVPPLELRYFSPEVARTESHASATPHAQVRLGRLTSSGYLRYRILHRESAVEVEPYETLRWTEQPDSYLRRSLAHALFEAHPLDQAVGGAAPTLDIELVAFEEVHRGPLHAGRVELRFELHDEHHVLARGHIVAERPARGAAIELVVSALGAAMEDATAELADRVSATLCPEPH